MVGLIAPWPRQPFGARAGRALALAAGLVLALGHGCAKAPEPTPPRTPRDIEVPEYLKDTVGEVARFAGREALVVQGFGFVTSLDGTGTTVMPPGIRRQILEVMHRNKVPDAEQILASRDTAVVSVFGQVPPGARAGERFDLGVRVVPGTETTSLEGGFVLACELRRVQMSRGVEARSEILALGEGGIFVAPFAEEDETAVPAGPTAGRILAGGRALKDREFRLVLVTPSVRTADQVVRLVNARFPDAAKGSRDPARIDLTVPAEFQDDKSRFLDLIGSLYMREMPGARDQRVRLLLETLAKGEDMDRVALCLEAFGAAVAPHLYPLGESSNPAVRFHAGRILARLQDARAVHVLEPLVMDDAAEFQEDAVRALGQLRSGLGLGVLSRALGTKSARVRLAAWQAMAHLTPRTFLVRRFRDKFDLHMVATRSEPFVYVSRTLEPEIAIFGEVHVRPPVLAEIRRVTATVREDNSALTLIARRREHDLHLEAGLAVRDIITAMAGPLTAEGDRSNTVIGLDLGYSDVVGLLHELDRKGALTGPVLLQPLEYRVLRPRPEPRPIGSPDEEP
ncbi:MAG: flagellar basal body P-ring protein FlgI [Planctomycetes bacterium]|nr:flagellar basal body P-ring protein FlgI [Planctomycetota bacterium]